MTAIQIIREIETLPLEEQREVFSSLQERLREEETGYGSSKPSVRYLDRAAARPMIKEIMTEHSELFRKLAQ